MLAPLPAGMTPCPGRITMADQVKPQKVVAPPPVLQRVPQAQRQKPGAAAAAADKAAAKPSLAGVAGTRKAPRAGAATITALHGSGGSGGGGGGGGGNSSAVAALAAGRDRLGVRVFSAPGAGGKKAAKELPPGYADEKAVRKAKKEELESSRWVEGRRRGCCARCQGRWVERAGGAAANRARCGCGKAGAAGSAWPLPGPCKYKAEWQLVQPARRVGVGPRQGNMVLGGTLAPRARSELSAALPLSLPAAAGRPLARPLPQTCTSWPARGAFCAAGPAWGQRWAQSWAPAASRPALWGPGWVPSPHRG